MLANGAGRELVIELAHAQQFAATLDTRIYVAALKPISTKTTLMFDNPAKPLFAMESDTYNALHLFASKRVGAGEAADLVQEAYLRLLQHEDRHSIQEPRAFLFRIISNLVIDHWRKEQIRNPYKADHDDWDIQTAESQRPGPETDVQTALQIDVAGGIGGGAGTEPPCFCAEQV